MIKKDKIIKTRQLQKPFNKGDMVDADVFSSGRYGNESLARSKNRVITINESLKNGSTRIKITNDKNNIFYGKKI